MINLNPFRKQRTRVVAFVDMFEEVPPGSKYLFSKEHQIMGDETPEQNAKRIIDGEDRRIPSIVFTHYYEVSEKSFDAMMKRGWGKELVPQKIANFNVKYYAYLNGPKADVE